MESVESQSGNFELLTTLNYIHPQGKKKKKGHEKQTKNLLGEEAMDISLSSHTPNPEL